MTAVKNSETQNTSIFPRKRRTWLFSGKTWISRKRTLEYKLNFQRKNPDGISQQQWWVMASTERRHCKKKLKSSGETDKNKIRKTRRRRECLAVEIGEERSFYRRKQRWQAITDASLFLGFHHLTLTPHEHREREKPPLIQWEVVDKFKGKNKPTRQIKTPISLSLHT